MSNISTENINTLAQLAASITDGDYIYIYKSSSNSFARIEKSVFMSAFSGGGATSSKVKTNVNAMQAKIDELLASLAPLAYNGNIPSPVGALDWDEEETPEPTPATPVLTSPTSSQVDIGTNQGSGVSKAITVKGANLTQALTVAVSGTGFSVNKQQISAANANAGTTITVTYNGTAASATGTLTISSSEVSVTVPLMASYSEQVVTHNVTINASGLTDCTYSHNMGYFNTVTDGDDVVITIAPASGFTLSGVTATASATNGVVSQSYNVSDDRIVVTVANITANTTITIAAKAAEQSGGGEQTDEYVSNGLVLHLDSDDLANGAVTSWASKVGNINFALTGVTKTSDGAQFLGMESGKDSSTSSFGECDNQSSAFDVDYDRGTIEIVVKHMAWRNKVSPFKYDKTGGITLDVWMDNQLLMGAGVSSAQSIIKRANIPSGITGPETIGTREVYWFTGYIGMTQSNCVINGTSSSLESATLTFSTPGDGKLRLGKNLTGNGSWNDYHDFVLCAVRVYSRKLTDAEMIQNYNVDKTKYGIS